MFDDFMKEGSVRKITDENSFSVVENCYEAIRELIDALMALRGGR